MDFIVKIPENLPEIIENNGEEVKAWLAEVTQKYNGLVVTAESMKSAKDDKAKLNKLRTALEERRKEVKRDYLAPYMAFEAKYKEILALIDEPIASIDKQVKALDEQEAKAKYERLYDYFGKCVASMDVPEINFDRILNPKWKNKTMKEDALEQEIYDRLCEIQNDVQELKGFYADSPHYTAIMNCYMQGYDKGCALAYAAALIAEEKRREEQSATQEAARAEQDVQRASQQPVREPEPEPAHVYRQEPEKPTQATQVFITGTFRVTGTKQQIIQLRDWMKNNKITFEIVKER